MYMRISKNHNSLGCKQPLCLDVNQSPDVQDTNARPHQLCWGDRECGRYMSCTCNTDGWPYYPAAAHAQSGVKQSASVGRSVGQSVCLSSKQILKCLLNARFKALTASKEQVLVRCRSSWGEPERELADIRHA